MGVLTLLEKLGNLPAARRARVTRTVVYEGNARWLISTLSKGLLQGDQPLPIVRQISTDCTISCTEQDVEVL